MIAVPGPGLGPAKASGGTGDAAQDPAGYLEFSSQLDGKCQILSDGGKLHLMRNTHPSQAIRYRLIRTFAGRPQAGRVTGTIAGEAVVKLGCTRVDGREQRWQIERLEFTEAEP